MQVWRRCLRRVNRVTQDGGTVAQATFTRKVMRGLGKYRHLFGYAPGSIGIAEMGHQ